MAEALPRDLGTLQGPLRAQGSGASGSQSPPGWLRATCVLVEFQMCKPSSSSQGRQNKNKPGLHLRGSWVPQDSRVAEDSSKRASHMIARSSNPGRLQTTQEAPTPFRGFRDPYYENFDFHLDENLKN